MPQQEQSSWTVPSSSVGSGYHRKLGGRWGNRRAAWREGRSGQPAQRVAKGGTSSPKPRRPLGRQPNLPSPAFRRRRVLLSPALNRASETSTRRVYFRYALTTSMSS